MLILQNISKLFSGHYAPILNNIDFELAQGEFCILIGSNGSGKSTLLKTITGEHAADHGTIFLEDINITSHDISKRSKFISSVSQNVLEGTASELTVIENLILSQLTNQRATLSLYKHQFKFLTEEMARFNVNLTDKLNKPMKLLSGGQRQMIATIMAILSEPKVLLLDEHTSALDPAASAKTMALTSEAIQRSNISTIMITHSLHDALKYGNRLIMLHQGKIVLDLKKTEKDKLSYTQLMHLFHHYNEPIYA